MYEDFYLKHLEKAKIRNDEVVGLCPFHDESNPSFYANIKTGVFYCHGCKEKGNTYTFAKKSKIPMNEVPGYDPNYNRKNNKRNKDSKYIDSYVYENESGKPILKVCKTTNHNFHQYHYNNGKWIKGGIGKEKLVLYKLPQLILRNTEAIFVVEGEKDANRLFDSGFLATCNPMGAGKWYEHFNKYFDYRDVFIIPDCDFPGYSHLEIVGNQLIKHNKINSLKVINLPFEIIKSHGKDISDFLDTYSIDEFKALIKRASNFVPKDYHFWFIDG